MMKVLRFCFAVAIVAVAMLPGSASASSKVSFKASSGAPWSFEQAAHLLRRAGFGGTPDQIEHLVQMGRDRAVDYLVDYEQVPIGDSAYPMRENDVKPLERRLLTDLEQSERERITMMLRRLNDQHMQAVRDWWTRRMVVTNRPLQEKMTLFWHGHFTSGFREVRGWREMYAQNEFFRENALADFETLLMGVAKDPAAYREMLRRIATAWSPSVFWLPELPEAPLAVGESFTVGDQGDVGGTDPGVAMEIASQRTYTLDRVEDGKAKFSIRLHSTVDAATAQSSVESEQRALGDAVFDLALGMWVRQETRSEHRARFKGGPGGDGIATARAVTTIEMARESAPER